MSDIKVKESEREKKLIETRTFFTDGGNVQVVVKITNGIPTFIEASGKKHIFPPYISISLDSYLVKAILEVLKIIDNE